MAGRDHALAVRGRDLVLNYGRGSSQVQVLQGLNLSVPAGSIYALLGPSGCGKTTLLRCVLGRLKAKGDLRVLGRAPGSPDHGIPGNLVGYMPQEVALSPDFTIKETMQYFGMLHGMSKLAISQRTEFLLRLLDLPPPGRLISQLSGGQQRRVSFAVALLQKPPLVILDEPTVGVDPVLRARIWQYLRELVSDGRTTVIITTHYIEEARQADLVAMMRGGILLTENAPDTLMKSYNLDTLEAVFLHLSQCSDSCIDRDELKLTIQVGDADQERARTSSLTAQSALAREYPPRKKGCVRGMNCVNIMAMVWKNLIVRKRKLMFVLFEFLLPSLQIVLFCLAVGRDPTGLRLGIVNEDDGYLGIKLSQDFLGCLGSQNHVIIDKSHNSTASAYAESRSGHSWGYLHFTPLFSADFVARSHQMYTADNDTVTNASIHVKLDMTNQQIALVLQADVAAAYQCFLESTVAKYGPFLHPSENETVNPFAVSSPIELGKPVYGELNPKFVDFSAPGIIVVIAFSMSIGLTALSVMTERKQGLLDRTRAAGVSDFEILFALSLTQLGVLIVQIVLMLLISFYAFSVHVQGSIALVFIMVILQGMAGMCYGLLISAVCDDEMSAIIMAMGSVFPSILLSGILWPMEGMPAFLRDFSLTLPNTYAAIALRDMMGRGWSLGHLTVGLGFIITLAWLLVFFLAALFAMKKRTT